MAGCQLSAEDESNRRTIDQALNYAKIAFPKTILLKGLEGIMRAGGGETAGGNVTHHRIPESLIEVNRCSLGTKGPATLEQNQEQYQK